MEANPDMAFPSDPAYYFLLLSDLVLIIFRKASRSLLLLIAQVSLSATIAACMIRNIPFYLSRGSLRDTVGRRKHHAREFVAMLCRCEYDAAKR